MSLRSIGVQYAVDRYRMLSNASDHIDHMMANPIPGQKQPKRCW